MLGSFIQSSPVYLFSDGVITMKKYELNMTEGSIIKNIVLFSIPLILSSVLQLLFNAADVVIVGRFDGETALAAVGSTSPLINLIINIFMGYTTGAGVIIARHFGAGDHDRTSIAVNTCITMGIIFGIVLLFAGQIFAVKLLHLMQCPEDVMDGASTYVKIYFLCMPAFMLYNFGSGVMRAVGDTKRPLYYLTVAGVANVLLNLLFVIKFRMGVAGVALATVLSQCISAFLVIRSLMKSKESYGLNIKQLRIDRKEFVQMTKIGIPAGIQGSLFSISNVSIQSLINSFGSQVVAANSASANIEGFVYIMLNSVAQGILTFVGQNVGANKLDRVKKGVLRGTLFSAAVTLFMGGVVIVLSKQLVGLYAENTTIITLAIRRLIIICGTYAICAFNEAFVAALRGLGSSAVPMFTSVFGICGLRLLFVLFLFQYFNNLESIYFTYPATWAVTSIVNGILLLWTIKKCTA